MHDGRHRYRWILWLYPGRFRRESGHEIAAFLDRQRAEGRYRSGMGRLRFWLDAGGDALKTGVALRLGRPGRASVRSGRREEGFVRSLTYDARHAMRTLIRAPTFTGMAVLTLAIGIGATTAIFSVVNGVILRPLAYPDADRLVTVWRVGLESDRLSLSYPDFRDWRDAQSTFTDIGGWTEFGGVFRFADRTERLLGGRVTAGLFPLLGVDPAMGRHFHSRDDRLGAPRVMLLSHDLWVTRFGGDSSVVGRTIGVDDQPYEITGVMPPGFAFPDRETTYWIPMRETEVLRNAGITSEGRGLGFIAVAGRLRTGMEREAAVLDLEQIARRIDTDEGLNRPSDVNIVSMHEWAVGHVERTLWLVFGAVALVLAIACANTANLALTRAAGRKHEFALRAALGAGRGRIARALLTESVLLATLGGAVGLVVAIVSTDALLAIGGDSIPRRAEVGVDWTMLAFVMGVSFACGIAFGLLPAVHATGGYGAAVSRPSRGGGSNRGVQRAQQTVVVVQTALALVMATGTGLLANSFWRLTSVDPGFDTRNLVVARVALPDDQYDQDAEVLQFFQDLTMRLRGEPGVVSVTTSYSPPFEGNDFRQRILIEGRDANPEQDAVWAGTVIVGSGYFAATGVSVHRGRPVTNDDRAGTPHVAVVNETMAARFWPGEDPVGKRFRFGDGIAGAVESLESRYFPDSWMTVVGVATDVRRAGLDAEVEPEFYRPHAQMTWPSMSVLVRTADATLPVVPAVRAAVWQLDPAIPLTWVHTMDDLMTSATASPRFRTVLFSVFGVIAAVLAVVGIYGVTGHAVTNRTHEIGIRIALGARHGRVVGEMVRRSLVLSGLGIGLGLVGSAVATRALGAVLFDVAPHDPITYLAAVVTILGSTTLASWVPARRASEVDPIAALRAN